MAGWFTSVVREHTTMFGRRARVPTTFGSRTEEITSKYRNTSHMIKRISKMIEVDRNNVFSGPEFDTEGAEI